MDADADPSQSELLDTVELLDELLKEGYLSPTDLDYFKSLTPQHNGYRNNSIAFYYFFKSMFQLVEAEKSYSLSRQDLQQSDWMSTGRAISPDDRSELRMWMRRKHREQLAAYKKHRATLREQERKPYTATQTRVNPLLEPMSDDVFLL